MVPVLVNSIDHFKVVINIFDYFKHENPIEQVVIRDRIDGNIQWQNPKYIWSLDSSTGDLTVIMPKDDSTATASSLPCSKNSDDFSC